jgi:hypothetical protein
MGNGTESKRKAFLLKEYKPYKRKRTIKFHLIETQKIADFDFVYGWSYRKQMLPKIQYQDKTLVLWQIVANNWAYSVALCYGIMIQDLVYNQ